MTDVTQILSLIEDGDHAATEQLLPVVYDELRRLAAAKLATEKPGQTLQATALVHEAYMRLVDQSDPPGWENSRHFFAAAAEAMRRILIERARQRASLKRGGDRERVDIECAEPATLPLACDDILGLEDALQKLEREHPRKAELVKLRFFAGLSVGQAAQALSVSTSTAENDWSYARSCIMKSLEKDRGRRYRSAADFAEDVERYLRHDVVRACPPSPVYRLRKAYRRNRLLMTSVLAVSLALIAGLAGTTIGMLSARRATQIANEEAREKEDAFLTIQEEARRKRRLFYIADMNSAQAAWSNGDVRRALELLDRHKDHGTEDLRGLEWYYLRGLCLEASSVSKRVQLEYGARGLALSPTDGKLVATLQDNSICIVDPSTGEAMSPIGPRNQTWIMSYVEFSSTGDRLLVPAEDPSNVLIRAWPSCLEVRELRGHESMVQNVAVDPSNRLIASADATGEVILWDFATGEALDSKKTHDGYVTALDFSIDGLLATGGVDGLVKLWRVEDNQLQFEVEHTEHNDGVSAVRFSHDGRRLATGCNEHVVIWDVLDRKRVSRLSGYTDGMRSLRFSADDTRLLSASRDKLIKLWDLRASRLLMTKMVHSSIATTAIFLDSETIASVGFEGTMALFKIADRPAGLETQVAGTNAAFGADSQYFLATLEGARLAKVDTKTLGIEEYPLSQAAHSIAISEEGTVVLGSNDGSVYAKDLHDLSANARRLGSHEAPVWQVACAPSGSLAASLSLDGQVKIWNAQSGELLDTRTSVPPRLTMPYDSGPLAFSLDGHFLAWADGAFTVIVLDLVKQKPFPLVQHDRAVLNLTFSPDGKRLATCDWGGAVYLWDLSTEAQTASKEPRCLPHSMWIHAICFTPDGSSLVVSCGDKTLCFWDVQTLTQKCVFQRSAYASMEFSPDGNLLLGVHEEGGIDLIQLRQQRLSTD